MNELPADRERLLAIYDELCAAKCTALVRDLRLFEVKVDPRAQSVADRLVALALELGVLRESGGRRLPTARLAKAVRYGELLAQSAAELARDPIGFQWLLRGLDALHPVLAGSVLAEEALFPRNDFSLVGKLYSESLIFSFYSRLTARLACEAKPRRVFELGAGTGGTAKSVLDGTSAHLLFTDLSPLLLEQARGSLQFGERLGFQVLDMDQERWDVTPGFDVAIALNVVHLAKDVPAVLSRLRHALAPGGTLLLGEVSPPEEGTCFPFMDFTFGLLPSFSGRLLGPAQWQGHLKTAGFEAVAFFPLTRSDAPGSTNYGGVYRARRSSDG
ncbi:MAG: class I SAM-dependent methyltransferase [Archangium sp.]|nr:class I SAM-dependent methyltransferase [Archangium sp.]